MLQCRWPTAIGTATSQLGVRPARLICGHVRAAAPRRRHLPSGIPLGRFNSSSAAPTASSSSPRDTLSSLLASFADSSHNSITADAAWQGRVSRALENLQGPSGARNQILLLRPRSAVEAGNENDLLGALTQDALQDPQGKAASLLREVRSVAQAKRASGSNDAVSTTRLVYAREAQARAEEGVLSGPWPLLKDLGAALIELQTNKLDAQDVHSHIYLSSQVAVCLPYSQLFAPIPAPWLQDVASLIRTFQDHSGLRVVVTHTGQAASADAASSAKQTVRTWLRVPDAVIDFVDVATAQRAQDALRGAMGLPQLQSIEDTAAASSQSADRSALWIRFQTLSQESGLPLLVSNLVEAEQRAGKLAGVASPTEEGDVAASSASSASTASLPHLSLLASHATQHLQSRLNLALSDYDALLSLSAHLTSSAQTSSLRLTQQILASVQDDLLRPPASTAALASQEPPLLPAWWKMPFMGDARVRERVQASFEREWLGGKGVEERLIWWAGRVSDVAKREREEMRRLVESLAKGSEGPRDGRESGKSEEEVEAGQPSQSGHSASLGQLNLRVVQLPATQLLQLRAALSTSAPSEGGDSNIGDAALALTSRPNLLAEPVQRARDHVLGRTRAVVPHRAAGASGAAPSVWSRLWPSASREAPATASATHVAPPPPSLLDTVQSAAQRATYRFWTLTGLSASLALYGRIVDVLTASSSSLISTTTTSPSYLLPHFTPSTSLSVFLLGTTLALYRLQRDHSRLARKVVRRDLVERVPLNVKAELEGLVRREVGEEGVWRARREVGERLGRWVRGERERVGRLRSGGEGRVES